MKKYIIAIAATTIAVAGVTIIIEFIKAFYEVSNYIELTKDNEDPEEVLD